MIEENILQFDAARAGAVNGMDTPPDNAVRAVELGQANGMEPAVVLGDLENIDASTRRMMTTELVRNNRQLQDYINAHPLNPVISNDDWAQMDEVSQLASLQAGRYKTSIADRFLHSLTLGVEQSIGLTIEGATYPFNIDAGKWSAENFRKSSQEKLKGERGEFAARELDYFATQTVPGTIGTMLGTMATVIPSAVVGGIPGASIHMGLMGGAQARNEAKAFGADETTQATAFAVAFAVNALLGAVQFETLIGTGTKALAKGAFGWGGAKLIDIAKGSAVFTTANEAQEWVNRMIAKTLYDPGAKYEPEDKRISASIIVGAVLRSGFGRVKPYIDEGKEIPYGVDPGIDGLIEKTYKFDKEAFEATYKAAQKAATRERNPGVMAEFLRQHTDAKIGVRGESVAALYGDKLPAPDDGILGWVPDLANQIIVAAQTGADILIPVADWLAKTDLEVMKALVDDIRFRPGGVSKREMEIALAVGAAPEQPKVGEPPKTGVAPAAIGADNVLYIGKPSTHHFELSVEHEETIRQNQGLQPGDGTWRKEGFVNPQGKFMDRKEAFEWVLANEKKVQPSEHMEPGLLDALDYREQVPERLRRGVEAVTTVRESAGLEPAFALSDSKRLGLKRIDRFVTKTPLGAEQVINTFDIFDDQGWNVGMVDLTEKDGGKTLYIENIAADWRIGKNAWGPKMVRDILRQIKEQFPNAESLTGVRVSGARETAGVDIATDKAKPIIDLRKALSDDEIDGFMELVSGGEWVEYGGAIKGLIKPTELWTAKENEISDAIIEVLDRIVPEGLAIETPLTIAEVVGSRKVEGVYLTFENAAPLLWVALDAKDPQGFARHEAIHHLKRAEFLSGKEWDILQQAAKDQGWIEKYRIEDFYSKLDVEAKLEEAVAEGYRDWANGLETPKELHPIFERMRELFDAIKAKLKEILGHEPTWEELFQKVESGEVGSREGGQAKPGSALGVDEVSGAARMPRPFERSFGPETQKNYEKYLKLIEKRAEEDYEKALKRATAAEAKRQAPEWKAREVEVRAEVVKDFSFKSQIAADEFFRNGNLYGEKIEAPKLGREFLNEEQLALLPREYLAKDGSSPDDFAGLFGYPSGDVLVYYLAQVAAERKASGLNPIAFKRRLVDGEVSRTMEQRYGRPEDSILEAAKEQALSETQFQMLHEETVLLAEMAKQEFPIDQTQLRAMAEDGFSKAKAVDQTSDRFLADSGRAARAVEEALLKGDFQEALRQKQRQYLATIYAKKAMELEKAREQFDKRAKRYVPREAPKGVDQEYANYIQALLKQGGWRQKLTPDEIAASIQFAGTGSLRDFVAHNRSVLGWDPAVADWIIERGAKPGDELTVAEFYDLRDAIDSIHHIGREVNKIDVAGQKQEMADFRAEVLAHLEKRPERPRKAQGQQGRGKWYYQLDASLTRMEEMLKDIDFREEFGPMFKAIMIPMAHSKAKSYDLITDLAAHFKKVTGEYGRAWRKSLDDAIPQDFIYDSYEGRPLEMTRKHLLNVMLNWGTRSNIDKLVRGYATLELRARKAIGERDVAPKEYVAYFEQRLKGLIDAHARPEDWAWVQEMWKPFKGWKPEIDSVARNVSGVAPKWVEESVVQTPQGEFPGGYWPVRYDPLGSGINVIKEKASSDSLLEPSYRSITTAQNHLKARTGYVDMVDLHTSVEQAMGVMQQTVHDIAYRDAIIQTARIFRDKEIRAGIRKHYGVEYEKQLMPWLRRVANQVQDSGGLEWWEKALQWTRINLVAHTLPLNLKVLLSPDIGVPNPKQWAAFQANRAENVKLAMEKSDEIRHMVYNMDRDFREMIERGLKGGGYKAFQVEAVRWGFWPTMKVSQQFRMMTFVDQYNKALGDGRTEFEAAKIADSYVRERHGAASVVDLPSIMANNEFVKTMTLFYGYFNTMYNWQRQIKGAVEQRRWSDAAVATLGGVIVGGAFNALVFNQPKKDEGWWKFMAKAIVMQPLGTIPFLRGASTFMFEGFLPSNQWSSVLKAAGSLYDDLARKANGKPMEAPIKNTANVVGIATGLPMAQIGRTGEFIRDVQTGAQRPKGFWDWYRGVVHGEIRLRK